MAKAKVQELRSGFERAKVKAKQQEQTNESGK